MDETTAYVSRLFFNFDTCQTGDEVSEIDDLRNRLAVLEAGAIAYYRARSARYPATWAARQRLLEAETAVYILGERIVQSETSPA